MRGEYTQNVPLSVTYATAPAAPLSSTHYSDQSTDTEPEHLVLGNSNVPELAVSFTSSGLVNVWNVKRQLKVGLYFEYWALFYVSLMSLF